MKKSLIALAVLAASGAAMAQSSVTLFGIIDATYAYGSGSLANKSQLTNSGYNSSRLGFRAAEYLGGGMSASFWLEAGVNNDNGSGGTTSTNNQGASGVTGGGGLTFNRRSTVSLNGGFGEVRLGRDYTPQFWNLTVFDPFGTNGVGTTQTQCYMGENLSNAANKKDGNGLALRAGYANGPINVALAFSDTKFLSGNIKAVNLGGQYDLGVAKIMAHYNQDDVKGGNEGKGFLIGGLVPVGAGEIRLAYSTYKIDTVGADPRSNKIALGYVHNLSKRTALYETYAHVSNKNGAAQSLNGSVTAAGDNSNGYDFGIRHSF